MNWPSMVSGEIVIFLFVSVVRCILRNFLMCFFKKSHQVLCFILLVFVTSNAHALETVTLQLKWFHQFQFAGYYAALEQGYYKEVGLNVVIRERTKTSTPVDDVLSGIANYGISDSSLILHRLNDKPVTVLAAIFQHSPLVLMTRAEDNIFSPFELKGKRVMRQKNIDDASITAMFHQLGLQKGDMIDVPHSFDNNDLFTKKVDAISAYRSDQPFLAKQKGINVRVIDPNNYGIDFYGDMLFTSESEMNNHPERAIKFMQASIKGWRYALDNKLEIAELLLDKYQFKGTREHLLFEADELHKVIIPDLIEMGHLNKERFQRIANIYRQQNIALKDSRLDHIDYRDYLDAEKKFPVWMLWSLGILILTIIVIAILAGINRRLNHVIAERTSELQATNKHLEHYIHVVNKFVITSSIDINGIITGASDAFCKISQYSKEELIGQPHYIVRHPDMLEAEYDDMWETITSGQHWCGEIKNRAKDGSEYWVDVNIEPKFDDHGVLVGYTSIRNDITDKKKIEKLAITDDLTQLNNRAKLDSVLAYECCRIGRSHEHLSVILLDIDHFKKINDNLGHLVGDQVLREIAQALQQQIRIADIVGRWGGEEFMIVCPSTDVVGAEVLANKICQNIAQQEFLDGLAVTSSFGVASLLNGEEIVELIQRADEALYEAKAQGRNRVVKSVPLKNVLNADRSSQLP